MSKTSWLKTVILLSISIRLIDAFECDKHGNFPNTQSPNCRDYYFCTKSNNGSNLTLSLSCSDGMAFNPNTSRCEYEFKCPNVINTFTTQTCNSPGIFPNHAIPGCKSYFGCVDMGGYYQTYYFNCWFLTRFDPNLGFCTLTYKCPANDISITTSKPSFSCISEGKFPDEFVSDCSAYYSCTLFLGMFSKFRFTCPIGTKFDPTLELCSYSYTCPKSNLVETSTTRDVVPIESPTISPSFTCTRNGRFPDPEVANCKGYILCVLRPNGEFSEYRYTCPNNSSFNPELGQCVLSGYQCPSLTTPSPTTTDSTTTDSTTTDSTTTDSTTTDSTTTDSTTTDPTTTDSTTTDSTTTDSTTTDSTTTDSTTTDSTTTDSTTTDSTTTDSTTTDSTTTDSTTIDSTVSTPPPPTTTEFPITTISPSFTCTRNGRFPDPEVANCKGYILCVLRSNGEFSEYRYTCPNNSSFNPELGQCVLSGYQCPSLTTPSPTSTESTSANTDPSLFVCPAQGRFPDPQVLDCKGYILCALVSNGLFNQYRYLCPNGSLFSPIISQCVLSGYECPISTTTASTTTPASITAISTSISTTTISTSTAATPLLSSTESPIRTTTVIEPFVCRSTGRFADPTIVNCKGYILCALSNGRFIKYSYTCPGNTFFNPNIRQCVVSGYQCLT